MAEWSNAPDLNQSKRKVVSRAKLKDQSGKCEQSGLSAITGSNPVPRINLAIVLKGFPYRKI